VWITLRTPAMFVVNITFAVMLPAGVDRSARSRRSDCVPVEESANRT